MFYRSSGPKRLWIFLTPLLIYSGEAIWHCCRLIEFLRVLYIALASGCGCTVLQYDQMAAMHETFTSKEYIDIEMYF
jgi:hypothetical protein